MFGGTYISVPSNTAYTFDCCVACPSVWRSDLSVSSSVSNYSLITLNILDQLLALFCNYNKVFDCNQNTFMIEAISPLQTGHSISFSEQFLHDPLCPHGINTRSRAELSQQTTHSSSARFKVSKRSVEIIFWIISLFLSYLTISTSIGALFRLISTNFRSLSFN